MENIYVYPDSFLRGKNQTKIKQIEPTSFPRDNLTQKIYFTEWNEPKYRSVYCWIPKGVSPFLEYKYKTDSSTLFDYFSNIQFPWDVSKVFLFEVTVIYPTRANISR